MSDRDYQDITPEYDEYSLAALLKEYARKNAAAAQSSAASASPDASPSADAGREAPPPAPEPPAPEAAAEAAESAAAIADRSRRAAMSTLGQALRHYQMAHPAPAAPAPEKQPEAEQPVTDEQDQAADRRASAVQADREAFSEPMQAPRQPRVTVGEDGIITILYGDNAGMSAASAEASDAVPVQRRAARRTVPEEAYTPAAEEPEDEEPDDDVSDTTDDRGERTPRQPRRSFTESVLAPAIRMAATRIARRQLQKAEADNWPEPVDIRDTPELTPGNASKYYTSLLRPLTMRFRISLVLTVMLAWISLRLPMAGMLDRSLPLQAGVSLALLLAVMMAALDVVTTGLQQLFDLKPGAEALAAVASLLSCADAALVLFGQGEALPFCSIGAAALTAALWGEQLTCKALRRTFRTAAASKNPSYLAVGGEDDSLLRTDREDAAGIVRRSESQDLCRSMFAAAAPFLLGAALLLSIVASLGGRGMYFLHTFSALVSVSTSFAAFFGFALPYAMASRKLRNSGAALAGYDGCAAIGRSRSLVITDEDLFPPGTMRFSEINVAEGIFVGKVVGSTAALLSASGSGVADLFDELVSRRGYNVPHVEEFTVHEGGGLSGMIGGEKVLVGSAGFMNLMGTRLPQNLPTQNSICTSISGELVGVFVIDYIPVTSVQEALVTLMRGKTKTVFAIRDFNITPRMIGKLFRMPTDNFNFPSFRERYRIIGETADDAPIDAIISRSGMLPLVETAEAAGHAYNTCRRSAILSLIGACIGMVIMFLLCRVGSYDTASAGNVLSFMVLWCLPAIILSLGQSR